jgi:hypothetical protein
MNDHFGPGPIVHPEPTPDGLARAFRDADRRRLRKAVLATAMPVLLSVALASPFGPSDRAGLDPVTPPAVSATTQPSPSSPPALREATPIEGPGGPAGTAAASSPPTAALPPSAAAGGGARSLPDDWDSLVFVGDGTSYGDFTVREPLTLDGNDITHGGAGDTYGIYLESEDRGDRGGWIHLPNRPAANQWYGMGAPLNAGISQLKPGRYRVWVVGTGPTWIAIRVDGEQNGFTVHTRHPAATALRSKTDSGQDSTGLEVRLPVPAVPTEVVGLMLGDTSGGPPVGQFGICLADPGAACTSGDENTSHPAVGNAEDSVSFPFWLDENQRREVSAKRDVGDPTSPMTVTTTYFLIYLDV